MATGFCNRWTYGLGDAWVSKGEVQDTHLQETALRAAGGERLRTKHTSGGHWDRPGLHRLLKQLRPGDVVVVWVVLSRWTATHHGHQVVGQSLCMRTVSGKPRTPP